MSSIARGTAWRILVLGTVLALAPGVGAAGALDALSNKDAAGGLRAALGKGIDAAVGRLGVAGGFLDNAAVTIPLPPALEKADRALRMLGMSGDADELKAAMNHAAEAAVAESKPVLKQALTRMSIDDAKGILTGGDDSATQYFRRTTRDELAVKFKPIVARATSKVKLGALYDQYAGKAAELGLVSANDAKLDDYVTAKALDGLYTVIADEERAIRKDPLGQTSSLLRKVFGSL